MWNKIQVIIFTTIVTLSISFAWDGYDYDSGSYVEIDKGNLVRSGEEIEYYDYIQENINMLMLSQLVHLVRQ